MENSIKKKERERENSKPGRRNTKGYETFTTKFLEVCMSPVIFIHLTNKQCWPITGCNMTMRSVEWYAIFLLHTRKTHYTLDCYVCGIRTYIRVKMCHEQHTKVTRKMSL